MKSRPSSHPLPVVGERKEVRGRRGADSLVSKNPSPRPSPRRRGEGVESFLRLADAAFRTGDGLAFRGTNWKWERGQHWALVGANGSGKSLLARALAGQVPVARGEIEYGFPPPEGRAHEDAVALVSFEQAHEVGLDGLPASRWFTLEHAEIPRVLDFLSRERIEEINPFEVGGAPRRSPAAFARDRKRALKLLRIENLADRDLLALSNGERRKILIARALLKNPKLLILDDPFAGLDAESRKHFSHVVTALIREGKIHILLVTMRPDELPRGITHILRVANCKVVAQTRRAGSVVRGGERERTERSLTLAGTTGNGSLTLTTTPVIHLENVTVSYGRKEILRDFSWNVRRGESWAVLGPNGSGKTTLLSLITGDNPQAYSNDVFVFGKRRGEESIWELRRKIGVVSPDEHLHCDGALRCEDIVTPGWDDPEQDGPTRKQRQSAKRWLTKLGLAKIAKESFATLSPGQQRIVLLARALAKEPGILVLDEPCQGLDEQHRKQFIRAVEDVMKHSEITVLYVTHHRDEIPRGISRVLRLRR